MSRWVGVGEVSRVANKRATRGVRNPFMRAARFPCNHFDTHRGYNSKCTIIRELHPVTLTRKSAVIERLLGPGATLSSAYAEGSRCRDCSELYSHQGKYSHDSYLPLTRPNRQDPYTGTMPGKVKAYELQSKCGISSFGFNWSPPLTVSPFVRSFCRGKNDLIKQLAELKHDLLTLRVQKIAGGSAAKLTKMFVVPHPRSNGETLII